MKSYYKYKGLVYQRIRTWPEGMRSCDYCYFHNKDNPLKHLCEILTDVERIEFGLNFLCSGYWKRCSVSMLLGAIKE